MQKKAPLDTTGRPPGQDYFDYYGTRTNSSGYVVPSYLAGQGLSRFFNDTVPVFSYYNTSRVTIGQNLPYALREDCIVDDDKFYLPFLIPQDSKKRVSFNYELIEAVRTAHNEYDKPLVFLVTTGLPHTIIYIIHNTKVYTIGFGFNDSLGQGKVMGTLYAVGLRKIGHIFENLKGALYSADHLMPGTSHDAKVAWVGFLNNEIIESIEEDLKSTEGILYSGTINDAGGYTVSPMCTLLVPRRYCEGAGFIDKNGSSNCLLWAQSKLNININCGLLGRPQDCNPVTVDEFTDVVNNMNSGPNLQEVIERIQHRLTNFNFCSKVSRHLGLCGGGVSRKHKNIKRKRKNKKTNKKTKKNNRSKR
jgi:hypothetical protein